MATQAKDRILERARDLIAGGDKPTVAQIARAAGVSRTSFYRAFVSRDALLAALSLEPEPGTRARILEAALDLIGVNGLAALSMDELAVRSDVSRATLYRLFPGKTALFTSLIKTYSPLEPVSRLAVEMHDQPPEVVMPAIARTVYRTVYGTGETRLGMLRAVLLELSSATPVAEESAQEAMQLILGSLGAYVLSHMMSGRLRRMHPVLALQSFIGPIFFHVLTRPMLTRVLGMEMDGEQAVTQMAEGWLRLMIPDPKEVDGDE